MLEKALFRKHTRLILYMAKRRSFSQKELIGWSLKNREFKDKDSIENKGQFRDKLITLSLLKKYTFKEFLVNYPNEIQSAMVAYTDPQERKRCILKFNANELIALDYPALRDIELPFSEYAEIVLEKKVEFPLSSIVKAFVFGCSIPSILIFRGRISDDLKILAAMRPEIGEELLPYIEIAKSEMEKTIKSRIAKN